MGLWAIALRNASSSSKALHLYSHMHRSDAIPFEGLIQALLNDSTYIEILYSQARMFYYI